MNDADLEDFMNIPYDYLHGRSASYDDAIEEAEMMLKTIELKYNRDYDYLTVGECRGMLEAMIDYFRSQKAKLYEK
jgi:hypothetical protein